MEQWKDYNDAYQVSDLGRVRSVDRIMIRSNGRKCSVKGRVLKGTIDGCGYVRVCLRNGYAKLVHQMVAETFLNHTPNGTKIVVDHMNNVRNDNRLCNLRIVSNSYNIKRSPKYVNGVS